MGQGREQETGQIIVAGWGDDGSERLTGTRPRPLQADWDNGPAHRGEAPLPDGSAVKGWSAHAMLPAPFRLFHECARRARLLP